MRDLLPILGVILAAAITWMVAVWFVTIPHDHRFPPAPVATEQ